MIRRQQASAGSAPSALTPSALVLVLPLTVPFVVLLLLVSCAGDLGDAPRDERPRSMVVESFPAEPSTLPLPPRGTTSALVDATVEPAHLTVTAWGTPGCMPYPVAVAWVDEVTVQVSTAPGTDHGCSTEYLAVSQVVVLPVEHPAQDVRAVRVDGKSVAFGFRR